MSTAAKRAGFVAQTVLLTVMFALLLAWGSRAEVQDEPWGIASGPAFSQVEIEAWGDELVADQVAELGCSTTPALTDRVAVKPAGKTADGVFDSGVVRLVSFDEGAWLGKAGKVFIVGWDCP